MKLIFRHNFFIVTICLSSLCTVYAQDNQVAFDSAAEQQDPSWDQVIDLFGQLSQSMDASSSGAQALPDQMDRLRQQLINLDTSRRELSEGIKAEVANLWHLLRDSFSQKEMLNAQLVLWQQENDRLRSILISRDQDIAILIGQLSSKDAEIASLREGLSSNGGDVERLISENNALKEIIQSLEKQNVSFSEEVNNKMVAIVNKMAELGQKIRVMNSMQQNFINGMQGLQNTMDVFVDQSVQEVQQIISELYPEDTE